MAGILDRLANATGHKPHLEASGCRLLGVGSGVGLDGQCAGVVVPKQARPSGEATGVIEAYAVIIVERGFTVRAGINRQRGGFGYCL